MNTRIKQKIASLSGILLVVFFLANIFFVYADDTRLEVTISNGVTIYTDPVILSINNITNNTLELVVDADDVLANSLLEYEVTITNIITGVVVNTSYLQNTDTNSETILAISGLSSGTEYKFEVQYAPVGDAYTSNSAPANATTLINAPVLSSIDNVNDNTVDLNVIVDPEFIGITMDFVVEIYKSGKYSHLVQLTRYINDNRAILLIDDIDDDKKYTFKVKYARENTTYFSSYSNEESITIETDELEPPKIISVDDITSNSLSLLVRVYNSDGDDATFRIKIINRKTGRIRIVEVDRIIGSSGKVRIYIDGLDYNTNYQIKVKYLTEDLDKYSDYSKAKNVLTRDLESQGLITICYNNETMDIAIEMQQAYLDRSATIGECRIDNSEIGIEINVCYKNEDIVIFQSDLDSYISKGAIRGFCQINVNTEEEEEVEVCYDNETIWVLLKSQIYQESTPGKCGNKIGEDNLYKIMSILGILIGISIVIAKSAVPLFIILPKHFGGTVPSILSRLMGIILGKMYTKKHWGVVFEESTHLTATGLKIVLINSLGTEVGTTYSNKDGQFKFDVDSGEYKIVIKDKNYELSKNSKGDELFNNIYNGEKVTVLKDETPTINIAVKNNNIKMEEYGKRKVKQFQSFWSNTKKILFPVLFAGFFGWAIIIAYYDKSFLSISIVVVYSIVFVAQILSMRISHGLVVINDGTPISFAVIKLYDKMFNNQKGFVVTDSIGRYYLPVSNGEYGIKVQSQDASGIKLDEKIQTSIKSGILRKKIIIKK